MPQLDIGRMLRKYWLTLLATVFLGAGLGVGTHFAWLKAYPFYVSTVTFECQPPKETTGITVTQVDNDQLERFKGDQAAHMKSDRVLLQAASSPRLITDAPRWAAMFTTRGTYIPQEALIWFRSHVRTRMSPTTSYIELSLTWKDKEEVAELVGYVRKEYEASLDDQVRDSTADERDALEATISGLEETIENLQADRDDLMQGGGVDSLDQRVSVDRLELDRIKTILLEIRQALDASGQRLGDWEAELNNPTGIVLFPEEIRAMVEDDPLVLRIKQDISQLDSMLLAMRTRFGPAHRDVLRVESLIDGQNKTMQDMMQRLLRQRFDAAVDQLRTTMTLLRAQEQQRLRENESLTRRLVELTQLQAKVANIERQIELKQTAFSETESQLGELETQFRTKYAGRVIVRQRETVPYEVSHPKWYIVLPFVTILTLGLVGGLITLREVLDQRVKGPADLASMPGTRVLGTIPHLSEDPSAPAVLETAFRDEPRGVIAERTRQIRAAVFERMKSGSHKTLLIVSATPGAGATSLASNLGVCAANADRKVLLIDCNFRRPSLHKVFGIKDAPGLTDVLTGACSLQDATQPTGTSGLDVLACGTEASRGIERLASDRITDALGNAASAYDLVLIDVAPAIVSGDAMTLADRCDAVLLVVRAFDAKRGLIERLRREFGDQHAAFVGVVINAVRSAAGGYFRRNIQQSHSYQNSQ
ncbi:MAG: AAA family ATPase [Planctomycetes bacterium]|nr:AAA family ATPase [Planctomycetota bacterium]